MGKYETILLIMNPEQDKTVPSQTSVSPTRPHKFIWMFLSVFILLMISSLGIFGYQQSVDRVMVGDINNSVAMTISDWKTYRNEEYGFEFKYPNDLVYSVDENEQTDQIIFTDSRQNGFTFAVNNPGIGIENCVDIKSTKKIMNTVTIELNDACGQIFYFIKSPKQKNDYKIVMNYDFDVEKLDQILSTFKFIDKSLNILDLSKPFQKGELDYFGTLTLTGYLSIEEIKCDPTDDLPDCSVPTTYKYANFNFTGTDNEQIYEYLGEKRGNSFVGEKSVGLGCYKAEEKIIESGNFGDDGFVENKITGEELSRLLASSKMNPVKLQITKSHVSAGRDAPKCYSLFRNFKVIN